HCFAGNCARGMSLVALHNGGAVGIGDLCIYQISSSLKYDIYYLEKDLKEKQNKLQTLEVEKRVNQNSKKIEKDASKKLDMIYPAEYQKKYISVDD
ncbi:hypothetical protein, partial [Clostridium sp. 1001270J_160509_D11]|uniref:hypothetical protein n=1 Tax=Clostridium sp. 1001270J_160509_D11 TaxID=2787103 RepID=UPI001A9B150B